MKQAPSRWFLATALGLLAVIAAVFFGRQNAGLQPGGMISGVKMLWLTYAIAAWLVLGEDEPGQPLGDGYECEQHPVPRHCRREPRVRDQCNPVTEVRSYAGGP